MKERSFMQSAVPELIAGLCPDHAEVELYNEKEKDILLDRYWDLIFFLTFTRITSTLRCFRQFFEKRA